MLGACSGSGDAAGGVAASVEGDEITAEELDAEVATRAESSDLSSQLAGDESDQLRETLTTNVLTELIRSRIVDIAAERENIEVADDDIAEQRAQVIEQVGGEEEFEQIIADSNVSDEQLQRTLRDQAIQAAIGETQAVEVSSEDVRGAFDSDAQGQYGETVDVRHVLTETEEQAQEAIDRIESGEDFAAVAEDMSIDPGSGANGGDLGSVPRGATVAEFEEAAFGAEVGKLVGPVKSEFGFHVIEVTDKTPAPAFADVRADIRTQLETAAQSQAFGEFVTELAGDLDIEVDEQYGVWDADTLAVVPEDQQAPPGLGTAPPVPPGAVPTEAVPSE